MADFDLTTAEGRDIAPGPEMTEEVLAAVLDSLAVAARKTSARLRAEREATPPSAGDGSLPARTPVRVFGCMDGKVEDGSLGVYVKHEPSFYNHPHVVRVNDRVLDFARVEVVTNPPPPAPAQGEAAVEALALLPSTVAEGVTHYRLGLQVARVVKAALDRGAVPGYGPTGASDGAGEVR